MHQTSATCQATATPATDLFIGLDVGDRRTHACVIDADDEVVERFAFPTTREALKEALKRYRSCKVVLEVGSQSPWMSSFLRDLGHDVLVADARKVRQFTKDNHKTDKRDAELLARLLRGVPKMLGNVRHRNEEAQADLAVVRARAVLVESRTQLVQHVRGSLKVQGIRVKACSTQAFHRVAQEFVPSSYRPALAPILEQIERLTDEIRRYDRKLTELAEHKRPEAARILQVHGVGPVTAMAFLLTLDDPARFQKSRDVGAWLGLCPRVQSSGDSNPELSISRRGCPYLRRVLVQSAQYMLGPFGRDSDLRRHGEAIAARGGKAVKRRAAIAVARKLGVLMHRLLISGEAYEPLRNTERRARLAVS